MTLPTYQGTGANSETSAAWPTHTTDDLGILIVESGNDTANIAVPSGFLAVPGSPSAYPLQNTKISAFYKFATSSSEANVAIDWVAGGTQNHKSGQIVTIRGVSKDTPFQDSLVGRFSSATALLLPGGYTLLDDCLILGILSWDADNAGPLMSAWTNADLGSVTEIIDTGVTTGNGGGIGAFCGTLASHGKFAMTDVTSSVSVQCAMLVLALQAADKSSNQRRRNTRIANTGM